MKLSVAGAMITEKVHKESGKQKRELSNETNSELLGPFSVAEVHSEVEASVRVVLSQNYQSVTIGVNIRIPVDPTDEAVKKGLDYCFSTANDFLAQETKGAKEALASL